MELNRRNMQKIMLLIAFAALLLIGLEHMGEVLDAARALLRLLSPFLLGACIAFVLNVPMRWVERKLPFGKKNRRAGGSRRAVSMLLTFVLIVGVLVIAGGIIAPQVGRSAALIVDRMPAFITELQQQLTQLQQQYPALADRLSRLDQDWRQINWHQVLSTAEQFLQSGAAGDVLGSTFSVATTIIGGLVNFLLGLFFAGYLLMQKEKLAQQAEKILYATLPEQTVGKIRYVARLSRRTFASFISGQCTEAVILGTMFFVSMSLFRFPYALLIGVLIALTALVPIFGSFVGLLLGTFLICVESPMQALWFIVLFFVLQQIEGNFVYPYVVGNSVGLPSIWVLVAVTLGGSTFGILGMLVFIPLFSVLYQLIRLAVYRKLRVRGIALARWHSAPSEPGKSDQKTPPGKT